MDHPKASYIHVCFYNMMKNTIQKYFGSQKLCSGVINQFKLKYCQKNINYDKQKSKYCVEHPLKAN